MTNTNNDLSIGYRAGQQDSPALVHLAKIVELEAVAGDSGDSDDFDALWDAIEAARKMMKGKAGA